MACAPDSPPENGSPVSIIEFSVPPYVRAVQLDRNMGRGPGQKSSPGCRLSAVR